MTYRNKPDALRRRFPDVLELMNLMKFSTPTTHLRERRLSKAVSIWDLRRIAKKRTPKGAFDYTDGAAEAEISLRRSRIAYRDVEFHPSVLKYVRDIDLSTTILGKRSNLPIAIAPTGFTRMMNSEGEYGGVAAATDAGIPYALSTLGTASIEQVADCSPEGRKWFQLYLSDDRGISMALVDRAQEAGYEALIVTVDTPASGARLRDYHNGFSIPPQLTAKTVIDAAVRPWWWFNFLTHETLLLSSLSGSTGEVADFLDLMFNPTLTYDDLDWMRDRWKGKLIVKGLQNVEDCKKVLDHGADAIVMSNHGGRQLDRAPVPLHLLPKVREAVGDDVEIGVDTGIMSGADVIAALAMGANFTLIGRAYLYGLMAGGKEGVDKTLELLATEMTRTMKLLGTQTIADIKPEHVSLNSKVRARGNWV